MPSIHPGVRISGRHGFVWFARVLAVLALFAQGAVAQPSGGPYGPLPQSYAIPANAAHVIYAAPDGSADAAGSSADAPTTIEAAIARAVTGDAVILRGGTYRTGDLAFNQGITLQPYLDEKPVLCGTEVATGWEAFGTELWRLRWTKLFPSAPADWWRSWRHARHTPLWMFNNDMVFADGRQLHAVGWEGAVDQNSFYIDYKNQYVYLSFNPEGHSIEITAHDGAMIRTIKEVHGKKPDRIGPVIRGITFTRYAYRALEVEGNEPVGPADPATFGKDVTGTVLENDRITFCSRVAAYLRGDNLVVRHCLVSDTVTEGIYVIGSANVLLEKNLFRRNNMEGMEGYFPAAVKIFNQCHDAVCRDNLVIENPNSNGIWYDVGNVNGVFVNNRIDTAIDGFFFEISKGATVAGNVFSNCEHGIRALNSCDVHAWQNTLVNCPASFERTSRNARSDHFGWHPSTGPDVGERHGHMFVNNLIVVDGGFKGPLLNISQEDVLTGTLTDAPLSAVDYNVYVRQGPSTEPIASWCPARSNGGNVAYASVKDLGREDPALSVHDLELPGYDGQVFQSAELGNFLLLPGFPGVHAAGPLDPKVRALLGWDATREGVPGACPAMP